MCLACQHLGRDDAPEDPRGRALPRTQANYCVLRKDFVREVRSPDDGLGPEQFAIIRLGSTPTDIILRPFSPHPATGFSRLLSAKRGAGHADGHYAAYRHGRGGATSGEPVIAAAIGTPP